MRRGRAFEAFDGAARALYFAGLKSVERANLSGAVFDAQPRARRARLRAALAGSVFAAGGGISYTRCSPMRLTVPPRFGAQTGGSPRPRLPDGGDGRVTPRLLLKFRR